MVVAGTRWNWLVLVDTRCCYLLLLSDGTRWYNASNISACPISACVECCSPGVAVLCCSCSPDERRRVGCIRYMYGFCFDELSGVRYYMCTYVGREVPMAVPIADARPGQPHPPPMRLHSLGCGSRTSRPNVAYSNRSRHSGRCVSLITQGRGSSPADAISQPDSPLSPCMVAVLCCMFFVTGCRNRRVGAIRWSTSGLCVLFGRAAPPVRKGCSWLGVIVSRRRPFSLFSAYPWKI